MLFLMEDMFRNVICCDGWSGYASNWWVSFCGYVVNDGMYGMRV